MISKTIFMPDSNSINDPALVRDFLDRVEVCLDKSGSDEFLQGLVTSVKKSNSYTPNQYWRLQQVEENMDRTGPDFFDNVEDVSSDFS
jgi:hypothetical protein